MQSCPAVTPPFLRTITACALMSVAASIISLTGCTTPGITASPATLSRLATLLPADVILLGEQHDAPDHQRVHREVVEALAARGTLAALALEMAEQGYATTGLASSSSEDQVRAALHWDNAAWPWPAYGPAVMAAVRSGVPVMGANLPRTRLREVMTDKKFDMLLPGPVLKAQQQLIRHGHCDLLPESQISPMTRIQIARDVSMANTVASAAAAGKTVLLLAGRGHVERSLGVPRHLPPALKIQAIGIGADQAPAASDPSARFDLVWPAAPGPDIDHCEQFKREGGKARHSRHQQDAAQNQPHQGRPIRMSEEMVAQVTQRRWEYGIGLKP